jgi:ribulose-phosphate 3-epimerase
MAVEVVPAILSRTKDEFEGCLSKVRGCADRVQVDINDGSFAGEKTVGVEILDEYIDWGIDFEVHLMVDRPELWVPRCRNERIVAVTAQVERMKNVEEFIADSEFVGVEVGLAFDLETEIGEWTRYFEVLDRVLLMAVKAGEQGRSFDNRVLEKIQEVRKISKRIKIEVDGGLDEEKIKACLVAEWAEEIREEELNRSYLGMEFAVGSVLWKSEDVVNKLESLRHLGVL